jgi:hypothetical protein
MPNYFKSRSLMSLAVGVTVAVTAVGGVAYAMRPATPPTDPALSVSQDQRSAILTPTPGDPASADLKQWIPRVSQSEVYGDSRDTSQPLVVPLEEVQIPAVQAAEVASVTPPVATQSQQPAQPTVQRDDDEYSESSEHSERESDDDHEDDSDEYGESDSDDEDEAEGWDD